jgi:calcineurin-like phosphoesterase family protein
VKYIKTYEYLDVDFDEYDTNFWLINCKDEIYFIASLYHINLDEEKIKDFLKKRDQIILIDSNDDKFYITTSGYMNFSEGYFWYIEHDYEFMGEIVPTKEEIELAELRRDLNKYNL